MTLLLTFVLLLLLATSCRGLDRPFVRSRAIQEECPESFVDGACNDLETLEGWETCAAACGGAVCCQQTCTTCPSCMTYMPCLNLGSSPPGTESSSAPKQVDDYADEEADNGEENNDDAQDEDGGESSLQVVVNNTDIDNPNEEDDNEQSCPDVLAVGSCDDLDSPAGWQTCAAACGAATCCQEHCFTCSSCQSYLVCLELGSASPEDGNSTAHEDVCSTFTIDYFEGFNLNFEIEQEVAEALMPDSRFTPLALNLDDQEEGPARFYFSWYIANIQVDFDRSKKTIARADLFTYALDPSGEESLILVGGIMQIPEEVKGAPPVAMDLYRAAVEQESYDSRTGEGAYPHYYTETFVISDSHFEIGLGADVLRVAYENQCVKYGMFTPAFVATNSITYRSPVDANINYFNKDFIYANVTVAGQECMFIENIQVAHKLMPEVKGAVSTHFYGSANKPVRWMFESKSTTAGTPYLSKTQKDDLIKFKRFFYSGYWGERGAAISNGDAQPILKIVNSDMFYVNWELSETGVSELNAILAPRGLRLAPIKILTGDQERYFLTWNLYNSEFIGITSPGSATIRFEASVYVNSTRDPTPRFLVLEALSSDDTIDPVDGQVSGINILFSAPANLSAEEAVVSAQIPGPNGLRVSCSVLLGETMHDTDRSWIVANDEVFWKNGVFDKVFYDSSTANQEALSCSVDSIAGSSNWTQYLADIQSPVHAFYLQEPMAFLIHPWANLQDDSYDIAGRDALVETKQNIYSGLASLASAQISTGQQQPLLDVIVFEENRLQINYVIPEQNAQLFKKAIGLPDGFELAPMTMTTKNEPTLLMTLAILKQTLAFGGSPFYKAVWTTYAKSPDGGVHLHEFYVETSIQSKNLDQTLKPAADIFNITVSLGDLEASDALAEKSSDFTASDGQNLTLNLRGRQVSLDAAVTLSSTGSPMNVSDDWIFGHDRVYWNKGVYDKLWYDGALLDAKVVPVGPAMVEQHTPWSHLVAEEPFEILLFLDRISFVSSPWFNLEEI